MRGITRMSRMVLVLAGFLWCASAMAQPIPRQLNVQGVLRNAVGEVVSGSYNLTFRLFNAISGGTKLWEQSASVSITGGVFNVYLGPMPQNIFASNNQVWLEIQVGSDAPLPRRPLSSVGFAFMAERAAECDVLLTAATDLDCVGCVQAAELDPTIKWALGKTAGGDAAGLDCVNCVSSIEIVDGQVTSADIGDGEVTSADLASNLTLAGNTTVTNLLVKTGLYSGASMTPGTLRLDASGNLQNIGTLSMSGQLTNTVATGTAPFVVSSTTLVSNLNADLLDGQHGSFYQNASNLNAGTVPAARLPKATTTTLGAVMVGSGLSVDANGVLSNAGLLGLNVIAPLQSTGGQSPTLSIAQASATSSGFLSQTDWNTFNNKLTAVTTRSTDPFVGSGTALSPLGMTQAGSSSSGWLSAADWNAFNNKAPGSGSNSYIQNQTAADQAASFRISGTGQVGGSLTVGSSVTATAFLDADGTAYYVDPANAAGSARFAGPVGIGTTSPGQRLDVVGGNVRTDGQFISTTTTQAPLVVSSSTVVTNLNADLLDGQHASAFAPASGSGNYIQNQSAAAQAASFWVSGTGRVGGNFTAGALCLAGDCKASWSEVTGPWTVSGTNIYNNNSGNVGIKNTNPAAPLTVGAMYQQNAILGTLGAYDTRSTNPNPETYGMGITLEFKGNSANGLNDGGNYNAVLSYRQWSSGTDWSGGGVHQLAFTQNGNLWHRYSETTGSWGAWRQVAENGMTNNFSFLGRLGVGTSSPVTRLQVGNPFSGVGSGWPASAAQGILIGQDTDNVFIGLIDEGNDADRAAIVFGDNTDDYLRILFNNASAGMTELVRVLADGRVGIGKTTPGQVLDVAGFVNADSGLCIAGSCIPSWSAAGTNYWTLSGTNLYPASTVYNVGIGTTTPDQKLVVTGSGSTFRVYGSATGDLHSTGPLRPHFSGSDFNVYSGVPGSGTLRLGVSSDGTTYLAPSGGNVGVGSTSAPSQRLHVRGGNAFVDGGILMLADVQGQTAFNVRSYANAGSLWLYPSAGSTAELVLATSHNWDNSLSLRYTPGTVGAGGGVLQIGQVSRNAGTFTHGVTAFLTNGAERMRIDNAGRVGIGTTSPSSRLHVEGGDIRIGPDQNSGRLYFGGADNTKSIGVENWWLTFRGHGNEGFRFVDDTGDVLMQINGLGGNNGFVGIGTTTPGAKLEVRAGAENQAAPVTALRIWGPNQPLNANSAQDIQWGFSSAGSARIRAYRGGSWDTYLQFLTNDSGAGADNPQVRMHIAGNGNVGINTTSPAYRLDVAGSARVVGNLEMANYDLTNVNNIAIADPGPTEGLQFLNTAAGWQIDVSPENRTNMDGNLNLYGTANDVVIWRPTKLKGTASVLTVEGTGNSSIAGNLGIGTTNPTQRLHVEGNVYVSGQICTPGGCGAGLNYWALSGTNLYPTSTAYNVGIGTTTPDQKFVVTGAGSTFKIYGNASGDVYSTGPLRPHFGGTDFNVYSGAPGSGTLRLGIASDGTTSLAPISGNVGVGTTSPAAKLHVIGEIRGNQDIRQTDGTHGFVLHSRSGSAYDFWQLAPITSGNPEWTKGITLVRSSGNVGIGTTAPAEQLHVANNAVIAAGTQPDVFVGDVGCGPGYSGIQDYSRARNCQNYMLLLGNEYIINRPSGLALQFREANTTQMTLQSGGNLSVSGNVGIGGSFSSSVAPATAAVMRVTGGQIAIQQQTSEGNTRIFADFPPHHSWGIYHDNPNNDLLFTRRDGAGFSSFNEAGPGGTTTTTVVGNISLDEGNASFYGTVNARAGLCINNDCKASWADVVQGVTGSHVRGVVQVFGDDEGAARITSTSNYQIITKTLYTQLEGLFNLPTYPNTVREYYIGIRKADTLTNLGGCVYASDWRFWFSWANKNGHYFTVPGDWGSVEEGSVRWVQVPTIASQIAAAGGGTAYWRLEARIPPSCPGHAMKVYGIYVMAVDRTGGTSPAVTLASGGAGVAAEFDFGGGQNIALDGGTGNVGINVFPEAGHKLDVNGLIRSRSGGFKFPDGTVQTTAATTTPNYWTQSGSNLYPNNIAWNVGIGNTSPAVKLHVTGNAFVDTSGSSAVERTVTLKSSGQGQITYGSYPWEWSTALQLQSNGNQRFLWMNAGADNGSHNARIRAGATGLDFYTGGTASDAGNLALTLASNGRVGVNTTSPGAALEVNGDISLPSSTGNKQIFTWSPTDSNWRIGMSASPGFTRAIATSHVEYLTYAANAGQGFAVGVNGGNSSFEVVGSNHQAYFRGNVGIQHTAPANALHVGGNIGATGWIGAGCEGACEVSGGYSLLYANGFGAFTRSISIGTNSDPGQGNLYVTNAIGVGTASPGASVDIAGGPTWALRTQYLAISASNSAASDRPYIRGTGDHLVINGYRTNGGGTLYLNFPGDLVSGTTTTRIQETLFISATGSGGNGNVGIGTAGPGYKLDVIGDVRATGSVYLTDSNTMLVRGAGNALRVQTNSGWVDVGAQNTGWIHFISDGKPFYFNPRVVVDGNVEPYTNNTRTLGTDTLRWASVHTNQLCLAGVCQSAWPSGVGGSGTANYLPRWTAGTTLGNSQVFDNGTSVGIGTTSPVGRLDVVGDAYVRTAVGSNNILWLRGGDANIGFELRSGSSGGTPYIDFANDASVDFDARLRLTADGRLAFEGTSVGIGATSPQDPLDVAGAVRFNSSSNPLRITSAWSGFPDGANNRAEISNDTGTYRTLMIVGNKSNDGSTRRVSIWDRLEVNGNQLVTGNLQVNGVLTAGNINVSGEIVQVEDGRIAYGGTWWSGSGCWGINRFASNCRYTPAEGDADASSNTITLHLDNNQYRSVLMSHLDWSNTRFFDVLLSFDGGASYTFHKRVYTYRATIQTPYTSTIYAIAENLPIGSNVRVRIQGRRGRIHFEGFSLLRYNVGDTEGNREHAIATLYYDADNMGFVVDPSGTSTVANFYSTTEMRAPIFRDQNDPSNYYVDPNATSALRRLSVDDGTTACCAGYYTVSINEGGGNQPTLQFHDAGVSEGQIILQGDVGAGGGRGFRFQSVQTSMAGRFTGRVISDHSMLSPIYYDSNGSSCQVDPSDWTRVQYLSASVDLFAQRAIRAPHAVFNEISVSAGWNSNDPVGLSLGGHSIAPVSDDFGYVGWNGRRFKAMWAYGFNSGSSETLKKDIRDLQESDYDWALAKLRAARTVFFRYKSEVVDPNEADRRAREDRGTVYRGVPHIGVIAETLPPELTDFNGRFSGGYNLADMDGLLVAAVKALDQKLRERDERIERLEAVNRELMDRMSLIEQLLVDHGILK